MGLDGSIQNGTPNCCNNLGLSSLLNCEYHPGANVREGNPCNASQDIMSLPRQHLDDAGGFSCHLGQRQHRYQSNEGPASQTKICSLYRRSSQVAQPHQCPRVISGSQMSRSLRAVPGSRPVISTTCPREPRSVTSSYEIRDGISYCRNIAYPNIY